MKINLDIVNGITYKHKFFLRNTLYCKLHKNNKSGKICRLEIYVLRSRHVSFLCSPKYKVFEYDFLHIYEINSGLHQIFFIDYLKFINMIFDFYFKMGSLEPMSTKSSLVASVSCLPITYIRSDFLDIVSHRVAGPTFGSLP
jgi:hypothetical protein